MYIGTGTGAVDQSFEVPAASTAKVPMSMKDGSNGVNVKAINTYLDLLHVGIGLIMAI